MGGMGGGMGGMMMPGQNGERWTVKFETFDGQIVTGKLWLLSVAVECRLGLYEIKPGKIKSFQLNPAADPLIVVPGGALREGSVLTNSGETVAGKILVPAWWKVETELGTLTPDSQHLKTLTFVARVEEPEDRGAHHLRPMPHYPAYAPPAPRRVRAATPAEEPFKLIEPARPAEPSKEPAKPAEPEKKPARPDLADPSGE